MLEKYLTCYPDGDDRGVPLSRGMSLPPNGWPQIQFDGFLPAIPTIHPDESEIMKSVQWVTMLLSRDTVGKTKMCVIGHLLDLTPAIQVALIKPCYWRRALIREAYLLQRCNVNPEKVWRKMDDHRYREEITHSLNLLLALRRNGLEHEGYTSAMGHWLEKNK